MHSAPTGVPVPPRAARSVHLSYLNPFQKTGCAGFYLETTVEKTTPGSYFQACGFSHGYFGIQQLVEQKKVAIFSVWDPTTGNDPNAVVKQQQCEVLYSDPDARIRRFGGEGTGAQCMYDYDWQLEKPVRFFLTASADVQKTTYAAYIELPHSKTWKHLATFRTRTDGKLLQGLYSFIEDFRRDTTSATDVRAAMFQNPWVSDSSGQWQPLTRATFTGSDASWEAKDTVNAGVRDNQFFLQTGGDTTMHLQIGKPIERHAPASTMPSDLPACYKE